MNHVTCHTNESFHIHMSHVTYKTSHIKYIKKLYPMNKPRHTCVWVTSRVIQMSHVSYISVMSVVIKTSYVAYLINESESCLSHVTPLRCAAPNCFSATHRVHVCVRVCERRHVSASQLEAAHLNYHTLWALFECRTSSSHSLINSLGLTYLRCAAKGHDNDTQTASKCFGSAQRDMSLTHTHTHINTSHIGSTQPPTAAVLLVCHTNESCHIQVTCYAHTHRHTQTHRHTETHTHTHTHTHTFCS